MPSSTTSHLIHRSATARLARFVLTHRRLVLLLWALLLPAGIYGASHVSNRLKVDFSLPGQPGYEAAKKITHLYGNGGQTDPTVVVVTLPPGRTVASETRRLARAFDQARVAVPRDRIVDYSTTGDRHFITSRGHSTFALLFTPPGKGFGGPVMPQALGDTLSQALRPGTQVRFTGVYQLATGGSAKGLGVLVETLIGAGGALAVLAFAFASMLALLPLLIAASSILTTLLVGLLGTLHRKRHRSGGDQEAAFGLEQALVSVRAVAVLDVIGHCFLDGVPVGVVGVVDDELADRPEVALDSVQEAGVGWGEHQLDVVLGGPPADVGSLVRGEVVRDEVDPDLRRVAHADLSVERQDFLPAFVGAQPAVEAVGVHVVGALLPLFFVIFIISFPAGLILYWITTNTWTMGQQWVIRRRIGPVVPVTPAAPTPSVGRCDGRRAATAADGDGSGGGGGLSRLRRGTPKPEEKQPAAVGSSTRTRHEAPPPPPRKKNKRSGRRR